MTKHSETQMHRDLDFMTITKHHIEPGKEIKYVPERFDFVRPGQYVACLV